ncbi:HIT domain-containing protein [Sporolactobacillus sp. Y61]|uniref:HIT domain-containing protein n=1 Tax=Sporolactobacillus sp. Y61 TaxID=3160863 RepID=A0AAU8IFV1_9BACL
MNWRKNRIESARNGTNPMVLAQMKSGYAVIGDTQFLPGYCVLLPKKEVFSLNDLSVSERSQFLTDMSLIGDVIIDVCHPIRVNYDILGNTDAFLHAHIFPRYEWEKEEQRKKPVWLYDASNWFDADKQFNMEKHGKLKNELARNLSTVCEK